MAYEVTLDRAFFYISLQTFRGEASNITAKKFGNQMDKFFQPAGAFFYPFIIILLFAGGIAAQNGPETRSIGHETFIDSADLSDRSPEPTLPGVPPQPSSLRVESRSQRGTPTSPKGGGLPIRGKLEFVEVSQESDAADTLTERSAVQTGSIEPIETDETGADDRFRFAFPKPEERPPFFPRHFALPDDEYQPYDRDDKANGKPKERFHWRPAIEQSLMIQGVQHGYALIFQEKTRRALKGKFFEDYVASIKGLRGWSDGNKFFTNYIAHPMQGAMTGFIFLQNHDRMKKQKFGESKQYWKDRFKAFVWSTAWSTNWELGPISQSSIGNVGLYDHQGYVDFVMTPTAGTGWMVMEEALDRYIIRHIEKRNAFVSIFARMLLNPMRSVANVLRVKKPWYRDRPFGD
jgi:hypothetical protein